MLVIISGVSGSGKNTIISRLLEERKNLRFFKSATTRARREGEKHHYFFTEKEFAKRVANGEFFETENVHGFNYGIMLKDVKKIIEDPKHDYIRDVEVHGTQRLRAYFKDKAKMVSIFIDAPDDELYKRLLARGESEERAKVRLERAALERACMSEYDAVVQNIDLDETVKEVNKIIDMAQ